MTLRRLPAVCFLAVGLLGPVPFAAAQVGLPPEVISAEAIGGGHAEQINRHVTNWLPRLSSDDREEARRARDQILAPLRQRGVSVAFRQAYADRLLPGLREHAQDNRDRVVVNALRIAGELATPGSVQLLESKLQDSQEPVRYAAVFGIGSVFAAMRDASPAIGSDGAQRLITRVGQHMDQERSPEVFDAAIRALATAMEVSRPNYEGVRSAAFSTICKGAGERARTLGHGADAAPMLIVLVRAGQIARDTLQIIDPRLQVSEQAMTDGAILSGQLLGYIVRRLRAGGFPQDDSELRQLGGQIASLAETALVLAANQRRVQVQPRNIAADLQRGAPEGDREVERKAMELIRVLTQAPFNVDLDRLLPAR